MSSLESIPQPALSVSSVAQLVPPTGVPEIPRLELLAPFGSVQPEAVCSVTWFTVLSFTPSTISISPPAGRFGPLDQKDLKGDL